MKHVRSKTPHEPQPDCPLCAACGAVLQTIKIDMPGKGFVEKHERELLVDAAHESDCAACRAPLLRHIAVSPFALCESLCGAPPIAPMVDAALSSDCNACRTARMVMGTGELPPRAEPEWTPQPRPDAEEIIAAKRDVS